LPRIGANEHELRPVFVDIRVHSMLKQSNCVSPKFMSAAASASPTSTYSEVGLVLPVRLFASESHSRLRAGATQLSNASK
jgi:hypothetical protein